MKKTVLLLSLVAFTSVLFAQTKKTTSATVAFDATTPIDALPKAENKTVIAEIDTKSGQIGFEAAVKNFTFTNPTIQAHFNEERWLNSDKFPAFTFMGKITDVTKYNFSKNGVYNVTVTGQLTIKDKTNNVTTPATIEVKNGTLMASASFSIVLADYGIQVGTAGKIAGEPKITVAAELK
ncbi:MAG: YceI family protein [Bacteroidetes bacterium]|jgi:polyisoprenoid-binding protein YceI|nr:YceI family protein [Bacteroidota bacterium]